MQLIDIGANLTHHSFQHDLHAVIQNAFLNGVHQIIITGASESGSLAARDLALQYPGKLYSTAGVHPHAATNVTKDTLKTLRRLADHPEVVALGEMGLDFHRNYSPRPIQEKVFTSQLEVAAELGLPVFLHVRDAEERFLSLLDPFLGHLGAVVVHCFTGTAEALEQYLERDLYIGITGWICDERRGKHLRLLVGTIPKDRLMLETDAPYLLPRDLDSKPKNRRNVPANLPHILISVAACTNQDPKSLAQATTRNAQRFFGLGKETK